MHLSTNSFSLASHSMTSLGSLAMAEVIIPQKSANTRNQCSPLSLTEVVVKHLPAYYWPLLKSSKQLKVQNHLPESGKGNHNTREINHWLTNSLLPHHSEDSCSMHSFCLFEAIFYTGWPWLCFLKFSGPYSVQRVRPQSKLQWSEVWHNHVLSFEHSKWVPILMIIANIFWALTVGWALH